MKRDVAKLKSQTLCELVTKEIQWLSRSDKLFFSLPVNPSRLAQLSDFPEMADQLDAFSARFGRLQDTLGAKVLPHLLQINAEVVSTVLDNLNRAEKLGWIPSAEEWLEARNLRNQMVHEYVEDSGILCATLIRAHELVPMLMKSAEKMQEMLRRTSIL